MDPDHFSCLMGGIFYSIDMQMILACKVSLDVIIYGPGNLVLYLSFRFENRQSYRNLTVIREVV
jgi:hypothetical protein